MLLLNWCLTNLECLVAVLHILDHISYLTMLYMKDMMHWLIPLFPTEGLELMESLAFRAASQGLNWHQIHIIANFFYYQSTI